MTKVYADKRNFYAKRFLKKKQYSLYSNIVFTHSSDPPINVPLKITRNTH